MKAMDRISKPVKRIAKCIVARSTSIGLFRSAKCLFHFAPVWGVEGIKDRASLENYDAKLFRTISHDVAKAVKGILIFHSPETNLLRVDVYWVVKFLLQKLVEAVIELLLVADLLPVQSRRYGQ